MHNPFRSRFAIALDPMNATPKTSSLAKVLGTCHGIAGRWNEIVQKSFHHEIFSGRRKAGARDALFGSFPGCLKNAALHLETFTVPEPRPAISIFLG